MSALGGKSGHGTALDVFLQRVGAILQQRKRFNDNDVADVAQLALQGLVQLQATE